VGGTGWVRGHVVSPAVRRGSIVRIVLVGVLVGVLVTLVAVLIDWLPDPASEEAERIEFVYWFATAICIAIFALVAGCMLYMIVRFRVAPDDESDGPPIHGHTGLEIAWTAVPAILVTAIVIVSAVVLAQNADAGDDPLRIDVTAQQYAWSFTYPQQDDLRSTQLVLPLGRPVELTLRANDVIHSFWIPDMYQKQDAVPGIETHLVITPNRLGEYRVVCTELCGLGHPTMRAPARVVRAAAFDAWAREQQQGQQGGGGGGSGASLFTAQGCGSCHAFEPAGTDAEVGPSLDNLEADARRAGTPLEEYVRESIEDPGAYVVPGYSEGTMPPFDSLTDEQIDALVQYLTGGGEGGPE
jgi:cytochrome c oxidase subunit 2